jgi:hypothetical protein
MTSWVVQGAPPAPEPPFPILLLPDFSPDLFFDQMTTIIKQLEHDSKDIFIFGDLNCDLLGNMSHRATSLLNSFAQIYQLQQLIDEPTRCTASTRTLIDVVYTNCPRWLHLVLCT